MNKRQETKSKENSKKTLQPSLPTLQRTKSFSNKQHCKSFLLRFCYIACVYHKFPAWSSSTTFICTLFPLYSAFSPHFPSDDPDHHHHTCMWCDGVDEKFLCQTARLLFFALQYTTLYFAAAAGTSFSPFLYDPFIFILTAYPSSYQFLAWWSSHYNALL